MKILLTINIRWFNAEAAYAFSLAEALHKKGHRVVILGKLGSPVVMRALNAGFEVIQTNDFNSYNPLLSLRGCFRLFRYLRDKKIDVINIHRSEGFFLLALTARLASNSIRVIRTRGDQRLISRSFLNKWAYKVLCHHIISSAEVIRRQLISRLKLDGTHVTCVYAGIDTQKFIPDRRIHDPITAFGHTQGRVCVAMLGRLDPVKGHDYYIEAAKKILQNKVDFFIFAYDLKKENHSGNIHWIGKQDNLHHILPWMDIGVIASIGSEVNCRVALEWMACGKPVIGTKVGVIPELIEDGKTGLLIEPRSIDAIVKSLNTLIQNPQLGVKMGQAARKRVLEHYTLDTMCQKTLDIFNQAKSSKC